MAEAVRPTDRREFEVAIICALTTEADAVEALFDRYWDDEGPPYDKASGDPNAYSTGCIGRHNVVLAHMPTMGKASAAAVASNCCASFPNIKLALVVGVCGTIPFMPGTNDEIVLGDVIISDGVVQYDFGRRLPERFVRYDTLLDSLGRPNTEIRSLLAKLKGVRSQKVLRGKIISHINKLAEDPAMKVKYPGVQHDLLFESTYRHLSVDITCEDCGCSGQLVYRSRLKEEMPQPAVHFGLLASGDSVMMDGEERDSMARQENIIGFEMEGAGVWDRFPCIVIKGACDYADSHKPMGWQKYAAATAAACAKAFLDYWSQRQEQRHQDDRDRQCLNHLFVTDPRNDKTRIQDTKGGLLTDAYCWVLQHPDFQHWYYGAESRLLWVRGDPGKGKTMLLCGIIDELRTSIHSRELLSYFFCQVTDSRINTATSVLRGLIYMLVLQHPSLISHILCQYDIKGQALFEDANAWEALSGILTAILQDPTFETAYLIVDALDECTTDLKQLLRLIVGKVSTTSARIKWIVSSRNWPDIEEQLDTCCITQKVWLSLELNRLSVSAAVGIYIDHKVNELARLKKYTGSIRAQVRDGLVSKADSTFLWVSLVCHELADPEVRSWHTPQILHSFPPGLDALYRRMLNQITGTTDAGLCGQILAVMSKVVQPITLHELTSFIDFPDGVSDNLDALEEMTRLCGSFLTLRETTVYFIHQSAQDFLLQKAFEEISPPGCIYRNILSRSLKVMSSTLHTDMYDLSSPGSRIDQVKEPEPDPLAAIRYSCIYWTKHLCDCNFCKDCVDEDIFEFLREHFLHWIEVLSLMKTMTSGIIAVSSLQSFLANKAKGDSNEKLLAFTKDAYRFLRHNRSVLEVAPLQIYSSALIFTPQESIVRREFENNVPSWIKGLPDAPRQWGQLLQTLEDNTEAALKFFVKAWDITTGTGTVLHALPFQDENQYPIGDPLLGPSICALSPNGNILAETDRDARLNSYRWDLDLIRLWNAIAVSEHGRRIFQAQMQQVQIWDAESGSQPKTLVVASRKDLISMWPAIAVNGNLVATSIGCDDASAVKIRHATTETLVQTLRAGSVPVTTIGFSPDGKQVVSGSEDGLLRLWDLVRNEDASEASDPSASGNHDMTGFDFETRAFSSSTERLLAIAKKDFTIELWDLSTGVLLRTLDGHSARIDAVVFSPSGELLITASEEATNIWMLKPGATAHRVVDRMSTGVRRIAFSSDSKIAVSLSQNFHFQAGAFKVLKRSTGSAIPDEICHISALDFSPDGKLMALGLHNDTIELWDAEELTIVRKLYNHPASWIEALEFSPDGRLLASAHNQNSESGGIVQLWDCATGSILHTLAGHSKPLRVIAFSPNKLQLASLSHDETVRLWDTVTGDQIRLINLTGRQPWDVLFSPDDSVLVLCSDGSPANASSRMTTGLWEAATGMFLPLQDGNRVENFVFSRKKKLLATSSANVINIWKNGIILTKSMTVEGPGDNCFSGILNRR
ncbi:hypothetical protein CP533_0394 [Ophiocordyceps camponoti-saundersi (nom. inval.)]|nr:hypothetical protein CP533_0394 [Ophiocordyceps camponoti-saundersi (nom. inval.)]